MKESETATAVDDTWRRGTTETMRAVVAGPAGGAAEGAEAEDSEQGALLSGASDRRTSCLSRTHPTVDHGAHVQGFDDQALPGQGQGTGGIFLYFPPNCAVNLP